MSLFLRRLKDDLKASFGVLSRIHTPLEWRIFASLTGLRRLCQYVKYERRNKRRVKDDLKPSFLSYLRPSIVAKDDVQAPSCRLEKSFKTGLKKGAFQETWKNVFSISKRRLCYYWILIISRSHSNTLLLLGLRKNRSEVKYCSRGYLFWYHNFDRFKRVLNVYFNNMQLNW